MKLSKTTPFAHQETGFNLAKDQVNFAYLCEQGTGKSLMAIRDSIYLFRTNKIVALVIAAPKGCYLNWQLNELPAHMPEDVPYRVEVWVPPSSMSDTKKRVMQGFMDAIFTNTLKVFLVNVEALSHPDCPKYLTAFLRANKSIMVVDESSTIRTPASSRSKNIIRVGKLAAYRRILTGTPVAERPLDLYGQCAFLCRNLLGHDTFLTFKHYYANIVNIPTFAGRTFPKLVGYRRLNELTADLDKFSFRVLKKDCLDLPEKIYQTRYVEATLQQKKLYNEMSQKMMLELEGASCTAPIVLTKLLRLQCILCGHIKTDDGITKQVESNRIKTLLELIGEIDGKIIVWCKYREDVLSIMASLPKDIVGVDYHGGNTGTRKDNLEAFMNDPQVKLFVVTLGTGCRGLTLNMSSCSIYYSMGYSLEEWLQSQDRNHRIGQKNNVTYISLVTPNSIDEKIVKAVRDKEDVANTIVGNLKSYFSPITEQ